MDDYRAACRIDGSKLTLEAEGAFREAVRQMPDGEYVLSVEPATQLRRSLAANRRLWKLYEAINEETGQDKDDLHEYFKARFLAKKFYLLDANGVIQDEKVIAGSTRRLPKVPFSRYMDEVEQLAMETLGCELLPERE